MADERFEEKTEQATAHRRQEARDRGHVARSQDLCTAIILLAAFMGLYFLGNEMIGRIFELSRNIFGNLHKAEVSVDSVTEYAQTGLLYVSAALLPFIAVVLIAAIAANILQIGFVFTLTPLEPNLDKLNIVSGMQRVFSLRAFVRLLGSLFKVGVIAALLYVTIMNEKEMILALPEMDIQDIVFFITEVCIKMGFRVSIALIILSLFDYGYQRWQYEKDLRMSKQEIKEELKRFEGDPRTRERRRSIHRHIALQRMMAAVPKAAVVITNPTELAIALRYDIGKDREPVCVAKGAGEVAKRIREIAIANNVTIQRDPLLAQTLYKFLDVGMPIPEEFYKVIAEVLSMVYKAKKRIPA